MGNNKVLAGGDKKHDYEVCRHARIDYLCVTWNLLPSQRKQL